jgi:CubicO group peptidase (beta-lactamase class C family)
MPRRILIPLLLCAFCAAGVNFVLAEPTTRPATTQPTTTRPITGKKAPRFEAVDRTVLAFMDLFEARAATVSITMAGQQAYSRGYGWMDDSEKVPCPPDALMRIASVTKPITAAAIKKAVAAKKLSLDAKAFELIGLKPAGDGAVADKRISSITVHHLLEHKGGWDRTASFDPMFRAPQIEEELKLGRPAGPEDVIRYMLARPLDFDPGVRVAYSNFGHCVLGRVLERAWKKPYFDAVSFAIFKPIGIKDIRPARTAAADRDPREVSYPRVIDRFPIEIMDANGGFIASAPALGQFMRAYWLNGDPRAANERWDWTFYGSLPGTTAMVRQREDGIDVAVLFNNRRDQFEKDNADLKKAMDEAMDAVVKWK